MWLVHSHACVLGGCGTRRHVAWPALAVRALLPDRGVSRGGCASGTNLWACVGAKHEVLTSSGAQGHGGAWLVRQHWQGAAHKLRTEVERRAGTRHATWRDDASASAIVRCWTDWRETGNRIEVVVLIYRTHSRAACMQRRAVSRDSQFLNCELFEDAH
jgi:hypothetical protein